MKKFLLILTTCFCITTLTAKSLDSLNIRFIDDDPTPILYKWMGTNSKTLTKKGMTYKKPRGFIEKGNTECFKDYPKLNRVFTCMSNLLVSKNGDVTTFLVNYPIRTQELENELNELMPKYNRSMVDKQHFWQMRAIFLTYFGNEVETSWQDSLVYYSPQKTKQIFNADTAYRFTINLRPEDFYLKKYKYVDVFLMQKKGRGYVYFVSFYTDKAKKSIKKYRKRIEGVLRYED